MHWKGFMEKSYLEYLENRRHGILVMEHYSIICLKGSAQKKELLLNITDVEYIKKCLKDENLELENGHKVELIIH